MSDQQTPDGQSSIPPGPQGSAWYPAPAGPRPEDASAAVADLRQQVSRLRTLALGGAALALVGVAMAAFALARPTGTPVATPAPAAVASTVQATTAQPPASPADAGPAPAGTIVLGAAGKGLPVLDIYEDFQCPACAQLEGYVGTDVDAVVASGRFEVRYHMMSFLDRMLRNDSSVRAANGGFCANDQGKFLAWHDVAFSSAYHPKKEGDGWTDAQLKAMAKASGLDVPAWSSCVASGKHDQEVTDANQLSLQAGVSSTPTLKLNGRTVDLNTALSSGGLKSWLEANS